MSSFKKNRSIPSITNEGNQIIGKAEDADFIKKNSKFVKEITIPFTAEMDSLLEKLFHYYEGDISRRKLCTKYLLKALKNEVSSLD